MKKIALILMALVTLNSCSISDDNGPRINYEAAEITDNTLPEEFELGKNYTITITYKLPSQCHTFATIDARRAGNTGSSRREIYVAAISSFEANSNCDDSTDGSTGTSTFSIIIDENEDYKFYFWTGIDAADEPIFEEVTVPVVDVD